MHDDTEQHSGQAPAGPVVISHEQMDAALESELAVRLGETMRWAARYKDAWWISAAPGWVRCDDELLTASLSDIHLTLTAQDAEIARRAAIRYMLGRDEGTT